MARGQACDGGARARARGGPGTQGCPPSTRSCFWRIANAGVFFQGGAAAVDPGTIVAALVNGLTGSAFAVGAAAAISRYGWLFPQLFVAYFAQHRPRRLPFYMLGAFGRVGCLAGLALLLLLSGMLPGLLVIAGFFALWTAYAFVSGIVAVPYNDIVARLIPSSARSRMLALRFFGGGLLALVVAAVANRLLDALAFPSSYAAVLSFGAVLLLISTVSFISAGEPEAPRPPDQLRDFPAFLKAGLDIYRGDRRFRLFVYVRWLAGVVTMALPFYVLQATGAGLSAADVATLLGAQTAGALASNPLWGFFGDRRGKGAVLEAAILLAVAPPALTLVWIAFAAGLAPALTWFAAVFFLLGAAGNGETIAQLGYLMEISPDDRRPAYSGYFNALVAPAALSPVLGAALLEASGPIVLFATSAAAALIALAAVRRLRRAGPAPDARA